MLHKNGEKRHHNDYANTSLIYKTTYNADPAELTATPRQNSVVSLFPKKTYGDVTLPSPKK